MSRGPLLEGKHQCQRDEPLRAEEL
jgi:hypothetical protein